MKILYGVQATGNGHITRARAMAPRLKAAGIETTWLFSGRPREKLFDMEVFGDYQWRGGLTFATRNGHVQYLKTAWENSLAGFASDVRNLDLAAYDLVICDFEPVTAWAAKLRGVKTIGIGHQYAFSYDIPKASADFMGKAVLEHFAPVSLGLGVHWHHFQQPIMPPIIEQLATDIPVKADKVLVYLPFEALDAVVALLKPFQNFQFHLYSPESPQDGREAADNIRVKPLSREGFQQDFADAAAVISNAGFELASEALQAGKKILAKPLHGQMEQASNALALEVLRLGQVMQELDSATVADWLERGRPVQVEYPDSAKIIVDWLLEGDWRIGQAWIDGIWAQTRQIQAKA